MAIHSNMEGTGRHAVGAGGRPSASRGGVPRSRAAVLLSLIPAACIAAMAVAAAILVAPAAAEDDDDPKRIDIAGALGVSALSGEAYARAWGWVRAGGDPNFIVARPGGETVMHAAAVSTIDLLQALIAAGGDCDRANARGASPLHFAAAQKDIGGPGPGAITLLTQCGADPNRQDERGATPLHAVFRTVDTSLNPKLHALSPLNGGERYDVMEALLEAGADPKIRDRNGDTPLMLAIKEKPFRQLAQVRMLLRYDAEPDIRDAEGHTALTQTVSQPSIDKSCYFQSQETVDLMGALLGAGADPNLCDSAGNTPLIHATTATGPNDCSDMADEVDALLRRGADPCIADRNGELPWDHADSGERDLLRKAGGYRDEVSGMCFGAIRPAAAAEEALGLGRDARRRVQAALTAQGFDAGAPDGLFGPRTRGAVRAWQAARAGGAPSHRRCGAETAQAGATGYLAQADIDALLTAAEATPEGFEPRCTEEPGDPCWQEFENRAACFIWNPFPQAGETATWSGDCLDNRQHGAGELVWRWLENGQRKTASEKGEFHRGEGRGHFVTRSPNGEVWEGPMVEDRRHGLWVRRGAGGDWLCYRNGERVDDAASPGAPCVARVDRRMRTLERVDRRAGPGAGYGNIPGSIGEGVRVHATGQAGEWFRVKEELGVAGFVHASRLEEETDAAPETGSVFRDCPHCPEMVVVPPGDFMMGSPSSEEDRSDDEGPRHRVTIGSPFAVGVYEVTFSEWDACASAGGCGGYRPDDEGWGRGQRPVINVSWDDAQSYVAWLSRATGEAYRLLSESEWEYVARAGTATRYWWGRDIGRNRANCDRCGSRWDDERTAPVGSFEANAFGLHDVHGNVWEWVQDCWNDSYAGAPGDGSAWESGNCSRRVLRGGSWDDVPRVLRAASRGRDDTGFRGSYAGFRVARTFTP